MQKITEKRILLVDPQPIIDNGTSLGEIKVDRPDLFRVGQIVIISSTTVHQEEYQVKRITGNSLFLGDEKRPIQDRSDLSHVILADNPIILANEQSRPSVPEQEIERLTYEEEPVVARRVVLVDKYGQRYDTEIPLPSIISDGEDTIEVNPDGSINVNVVNPVLTIVNTVTEYTEVTNVPKDIRTLIATFTTKQDKNSYLQIVTVGGTNFGDYTLEINDNKVMRKRTWAGSDLFTEFDFSNFSVDGKNLDKGDVIKVYVEHKRPFNGDFEATIQILEKG